VRTRPLLALLAVTATTAVGAVVLAPATSAKPDTGITEATGQVFMVNPVQ
jgi:hypothetical protein